MNRLVDEITEYMDFLKGQLFLNISVHFTDQELINMPDAIFSKLLPYNTHTNPYCESIKKNRWKCCIEDQKKYFIEDEDEKSKIFVCHADVKQELFYFRRGTTLIGYVAVSGYRNKNKENDYGDHDLWERSLSIEAIPDYCSSVIIPLCRMFELLFMKPMVAEDSGEFRLILKYINEHHGIVTLDELCEQFGRSQSYISHIFHEKSGKTLPEYCNDMKLMYASEQLLNEGLSVTEASLNSGFGSPSYFIMCFKNKYGITPLQLKKGKR